MVAFFSNRAEARNVKERLFWRWMSRGEKVNLRKRSSRCFEDKNEQKFDF